MWSRVIRQVTESTLWAEPRTDLAKACNFLTTFEVFIIIRLQESILSDALLAGNLLLCPKAPKGYPAAHFSWMPRLSHNSIKVGLDMIRMIAVL